MSCVLDVFVLSRYYSSPCRWVPQGGLALVVVRLGRETTFAGAFVNPPELLA